MGVLSFVLMKEVEVEEGFALLTKVADWQEAHMPLSHSSVNQTKSALATAANLMGGKASLWI